MRLIDADKLIDKLPTIKEDKQISLIGAVADMLTMISQCKSVDAVEVVRCGECLYHREKNKKESAYLEPNVIVCTNSNIFEDGCGFMWRTDFCSYGERKE